MSRATARRKLLRRALHLVLVAIALWSLLHWANDVRWGVQVCRGPAQPEIDPAAWRVGSATWEGFATTMGTVAATVPPGARIAIRAPAERWMLAWYAAYLLPRHHVLPASRRPHLETATHAVGLEQPWNDPTLDLVHTAKGVWIYRRATP